MPEETEDEMDVLDLDKAVDAVVTAEPEPTDIVEEGTVEENV